MPRIKSRNLALITAQAAQFLTNDQLAARAAVHPQTVSNLRQCRVVPTPETARAIARVLNVPAGKLFSEGAVCVSKKAGL